MAKQTEPRLARNAINKKVGGAKKEDSGEGNTRLVDFHSVCPYDDRLLVGSILAMRTPPNVSDTAF